MKVNEVATPGSAIRLASVARHVTDCAIGPGKHSHCLSFTGRVYLSIPYKEFSLQNFCETEI